MEFTKQRLAIEVVEKVEELLKQDLSYSQIAKQTGVSKTSISKIKNGTYKKAILLDDSIDPKEYITLKQNYLKLQNENENLKKDIELLKKRVNDLDKFESYVDDLGKYVNTLSPINRKSVDSITYKIKTDTTDLSKEKNNCSEEINIIPNKPKEESFNDLSYSNEKNIVRESLATPNLNYDSKMNHISLNEKIIELWKPLNLSVSDIAKKLNSTEAIVRTTIEKFNLQYQLPLNGYGIFTSPLYVKEYSNKLKKKIIFLYENQSNPSKLFYKDNIIKNIANTLVLSQDYVKRIINNYLAK